MKINSAALDRNIMQLQQNQTEEAKDAAENVRLARKRQTEAKMHQLQLNQEAGNVRGEASDAATRYQAIAGGLAAAAAVCACFPPVGTVIGAILAVVAAVFALIAHLEQKGKEQEAAAKEKEAGVKEMEAEKESDRAKDIKKAEEERRNFINEIMAKQMDMKQSEADRAKF